MNDAPIYPASTSQTIYATQQLSSDARPDIAPAIPREVTYDMGMGMTDASDGTIEQLIDLDLMINRLDEERVYLDKMVIQLFRDEQGRLGMLGDIAIHSRRRMPFYREMTPSPERFTISTTDICGTGLSSLLCRWRLFVTPKLNGPARRPGCHRSSGRASSTRLTGNPIIVTGASLESSSPMTVDGEAARVHHVGDDNRHRHRHHHQEHHQGLTHTAHAVRYILVAFLIPVLVGVAAGMTASLLGMMVGTAIAWLWIRFVRGGKRGNASAGRTGGVEEEWIESAGLLGEKGEVMEEGVEEVLPVYVEAPAYVERE